MPELPEVETTVRGLERVLLGKRIASVEARRSDLRRAMPVDLGQRLTGARVTRLVRRAKYGLIGTDRGDTLVFHLGMSGRMVARLEESPPVPSLGPQGAASDTRGAAPERHEHLVMRVSWVLTRRTSSRCSRRSITITVAT